ncbi:hypothetical protein [Natrinema pallidum]|uniref:Uncharacterized protein n=1 Tax=Natrinema pallidum TaxID=69527 RepID=A0A4P9TMJ7_9EURY|nr:hypothetical protein [Natrinema pallidum]QCW05290.1 hypothetical protein FGF80_18790 [Natrinema pallidum]
MSATESDNESGGLFDHDVGETVSFTLGETDVIGEITEVEYTTAIDEFPEEGETVTFKAVGGEVEKTVLKVNEGAERPITLDHGGSYNRTNLVEYSKKGTAKVVKLPDGREIWPAEDDNDE